MKSLPEVHSIYLRLASLILGSGDTFYTAVGSFSFRETVALTAPDFAGYRLRESGGSDSTVLSPASSPI
ncbi:hypothetical protein IGI04_025164 [Brassica rapa subsp. trilocularis]|uniref:Uncharacterized protein n=2 Tax=Brassica TaxID=3705 RepID=A0ABQ8D4B5_BRANA|nr:hypothetical protein IGI04_025164 [Brassica rapa subsp. trilocularis]KAH0924222.1 hypothetical protein HID58_024240 [Brassica napus]